MQRLFLALIAMLVCVSLGTGAIAHGVESSVCIDQMAESHGTHMIEGDQSDDKDGKGVPSHHANCHGHQLASIPAAGSAIEHLNDREAPVAARASALRPTVHDPALRPPQA